MAIITVKIKQPETWHQTMGHAPWIEEVWTNYQSNGTPGQGSLFFFMRPAAN